MINDVMLEYVAHFTPDRNPREPSPDIFGVDPRAESQPCNAGKEQYKTKQNVGRISIVKCRVGLSNLLKMIVNIVVYGGRLPPHGVRSAA